ncbi:MAG: MFS transporter [Clostridia bacterium]|nr:MFS transporter [Clostridia bacterium]
MEKKYLKNSELLSFSTAGFGRSMIYNLMSTFLLIFYTDAMHLKFSDAGMIILITRIFDAFNDPVMGIIVDKTKTKFGKLRPFLLISPPLILVSTILLFWVPVVPADDNYTFRFIYSAATYILWAACFTIQDVPFWGMSAVVSPLEKERNKLLSTARIFCTIGGIVPTLLVGAFTDKLGLSKGYLISAVLIASAGTTLSWLAFFGTKERLEDKKEKITVKEYFLAYTKNKPLILVIISSILGSAMLMAQTSGAYLANYLFTPYKEKFPVQTVMTVAIGAGMMVAMVLMPVLRKKLSLKSIYIASAFFGAAVHLIMYFVGYSNFYAFLAMLVFAGLPLGIFNVITYAMIADSVDYLEWKTGRRAEGACFACQTFISNLTAGISNFITTQVLEIFNYVQPLREYNELGQLKEIVQQQSTETLDGMFIMVTIIPAVSLALAAIPMFFNDYSGKKKEEIQKELTQRRENANVNG